VSVKRANLGTVTSGGGGGGGTVVFTPHSDATIAATDYPAGTIVVQTDPGGSNVIGLWAVPTTTET
jgi:hypothetical protein